MTVIRFATAADVPTILHFVRELADYERALDQVVATEELLDQALFSTPPAAEALIAEIEGAPVGLALFFHNFSTDRKPQTGTIFTGFRRKKWFENFLFNVH